MTKKILFLLALLMLCNEFIIAQINNKIKPDNSIPYSVIVNEDTGLKCSTPNLDSAQSVALPYYGNNQVIEDYLIQKGYDNLPYISFPSNNLRTSSATIFLEPNFLIPMNIYIYRDGNNNVNSAITEVEAREIICRVNTIFRDAGTAIQFYVNLVDIEPNNFFNQQISENSHVYDLWTRKRFILGITKGINVHFIRFNSSPEDGLGKATLPNVLVLPFSEYSCYVRTHNNLGRFQLNADEIASTLSHEIGHTLGLLHTHHPGRLPSLVFNEENGTISNGCYQESVSRVKRNYWYDGCFSTDNKLKCEINGDFLCDTEADPNQLSRVAPGCVYTLPESGNFREDNWGALWTPPTNNVMSYTMGICRNDFSRSQTGIMWMQMPALKSFINYQSPRILASSSSVCLGTTTSFTLHGTLPNDATVTWSVEPSNLVTVANGTGFIANVSALNSSSRGNVNIIYTIVGQNNCYIARIQKDFWVGSPPASSNTLIWTGTRGVNPVRTSPGATYIFRVDEVPTANSYTWVLPSGFSVLNGSTTTSNTSIYITTSSISGNYTIHCRANNSCGSSWTNSLTVNNGTTSGGNNCPPGFSPPCKPSVTPLSVYPNPVSTSLTVDVNNFQESNAMISQTSSFEDFQIDLQLYNSFGFKVKSIKSKIEKFEIDVSDIPDGIYTFKITYQNINDVVRIIVKH